MEVNPGLEKVVNEISNLPEGDKRVLRDLLSEQLDGPTKGTGKPLKAGWAKNLVGPVGPEFDEPLPEFQEYTE